MDFGVSRWKSGLCNYDDLFLKIECQLVAICSNKIYSVGPGLMQSTQSHRTPKVWRPTKVYKVQLFSLIGNPRFLIKVSNSSKNGRRVNFISTFDGLYYYYFKRFYLINFFKTPFKISYKDLRFSGMTQGRPWRYKLNTRVNTPFPSKSIVKVLIEMRVGMRWPFTRK